MKKSLYSLLAIAAVATILIAGCKVETEKKETKTAGSTQEELVKRGEYLVTIAGCDDCHSPKVFGPKGPAIDPERRLSGHPETVALDPVDKNSLKSWVLFNSHNTATVGPWGATFAANITSDATGIGTWTEEQFIKALREGKFKGLDNTRPLLPPMPWQSYSKMTDEDLKAMFAYLKTVKPVKNSVPAPIASTDLK
jgi:mono/diheme cytochrome c family protein